MSKSSPIYRNFAATVIALFIVAAGCAHKPQISADATSPPDPSSVANAVVDTTAKDASAEASVPPVVEKKIKKKKMSVTRKGKKKKRSPLAMGKVHSDSEPGGGPPARAPASVTAATVAEQVNKTPAARESMPLPPIDNSNLDAKMADGWKLWLALTLVAAATIGTYQIVKARKSRRLEYTS